MKTLKFLMAAVVALAMTSCSDDNNSPSVEGELSIYINGEHYVINLSDNGPTNLTTLCTEFDADVTVGNSSDFQSIIIDGQTVKGGKCKVPVSKINADTQIKIAYLKNGRPGQVLLNTLHSGIPKLNVNGQAVAKGDFYLSFVYNRLIMKVNNKGEVLFYRYEPRTVTDPNDVSGWWDFKKHVTEDGTVYYSYHANDPKFASRLMMGYDPGMRVILDDHYKPLKTIHLKSSLDGYVGDGEPLDGHDFYLFSLNHYIVSAYLDRPISDRNAKVSYLQEVLDGEVVFDWWSTSIPDMETWANPNFDTSYDYVHFNSLQVLPDGNLLCSFRAVCSVLKINRTDGSMMWRIDGAGLDPKYAFFGQHYVTLHDDNTLTVFDNGNGHTGPSGQPIPDTRLLRLTINPETGEVLGGGNILPASKMYFTQACGSFQIVNTGYVAGWGIPGDETSEYNRLVKEFDAAGHEIFSLSLNGSYTEAFFNASYRCAKYE